MRTFTRLSTGLNPDIIQDLTHTLLEGDFQSFFAPLMLINEAHVIMLVERGILEGADATAILRGLSDLQQTMTRDTLHDDLDLYFNVERQLQQRIGAAAGRMHTARSRNDLQACYQRMAVRDVLAAIIADVLQLRTTLLTVSTAHVDTVMPGYTHSQPAQPITFAHYLIGVHDSFMRDCDRLVGAWHRTNLSPLGAGALAGTGYPIDRERTAQLLGFDGVLENSIDAVASRDYLMEALAACVGLSSTASRFSADLITWSAWEYRFVEIADGYASGSSIMPQKKNPIALEHTRAKLAHVLGAYTSVVTLTKGLPFTHSRDMGSEAFHLSFDGFAETGTIARILAGVMQSLTVHRQRMAAAADSGYATATELADVLVRRCGLPFRTAHEIVGTLVAHAIAENLPVDTWSLEDVRQSASTTGADISGLTEQDVETALDPLHNVAVRAVHGGPAPQQVQHVLSERQRTLGRDRTILAALRDQVAASEALLAQRVTELSSN